LSTFGLATLSFFLVEKPAMSLKRSRRGTTPLDVALGDGVTGGLAGPG
jgi:peptidoglycan/LPS O-acetylase OafA/YrhL